MQQFNYRRLSRLRHSLPVQLSVGVLAIVSLAFATALYVVTVQEERDFSAHREQQARRIAIAITSQLTQRMLAGGGGAVWSDVSSTAKQHADVTGALRIQVIAQDGLVKAGSDPRSVGSRIDVRASADCAGCPGIRQDDFPIVTTALTPEGERRLRVVNAIPNLPPCHACHDAAGPNRGYLSIDFDLSALERSIKERRASIAMVGVGAGLILMVLMALLFGRLAMRSIKALIVGAQALAAGNLATRVSVFGRNELSLLARHFNRMAVRLENQVMRIAAAQTESTLLYTLVVEASKNLETTEFTSGVSKVMMEKLRPQHVAFFLEGANADWICAYAGTQSAHAMERGAGGLLAALHADTPQLRMLLAGAPRQLVVDACRQRQIQIDHGADGTNFAIPVVTEEQQIGLLVCAGMPATPPINEELLANLAAHLALAAANSRNYTGAITDALTGLRNRRYGLARLDEAVFAAKRYGSGLAVAICDIDHFKRVNDTFGHPSGDAVLRTVASRIAASVRKADIAVRYGGEEFMLIFPETAASGLLAVGEKVRKAIAAAPIAMGEGADPLAVTISVGIAAFQAATDSADTLVARADGALYRAKETGRNRVEVDA